MLTESSFAFRKWCFSRTKEKDATDATGGAPAQAALRQLYFQVPRGTARGLCALGRAVMMLWCRGVACLGEGGHRLSFPRCIGGKPTPFVSFDRRGMM